MDFVDYFNIGEGILWIVISLVLLVQAIRLSTPQRTMCWVAAVSFFLFGITDFVETTIDGWIPPWWLMLWKGACGFGFVSMYVWYLKTEDKLPEGLKRLLDKEEDEREP